MKVLVRSILLGVFIVFFSCNKISQGYKYNYGSLPTTPVNLSDFNTEYDDYNSTAPSLGELIPFCFSTNRNSQGAAFDIIFQPMNVNFNKTSGILKVSNDFENWSIFVENYATINTGLKKIRTAGNELGPNLVIGHNDDVFNFTLLYSTDVSGNSQINYISNRTNPDFSDPQEVVFLNSDYEDMYPTFDTNKSNIYFCSNRNGERFDIYNVAINADLDIELVLSDTSNYDISRDTSLSSYSDDKCPFIFENKLVFASNRAGGFGGFDLYYSILENGKWSEPINFGEKINTEFDEYRPILIDEGVSWTQTMMVFSSNRTGGFGGFDLYFVGIENE